MGLEMSSAKDAKAFLETAIISHSYSPDGKRVAIAPNTCEVFIYNIVGDDCTKWIKQDVLNKHDQTVTCVDWSKKTNQILSCAQDRTAFVWTEQGGEWISTIVVLSSNFNRAALGACWSPNNEKFALCSSARIATVCINDPANNWWVFSRHIENHSSSVTAVAFSPACNAHLATISTDGVCRVSLTWIKSTDSPETKGKWGTKVAEWNVGAWLHDVAFSPDGKEIVFVSHDSNVFFGVLEDSSFTKLSTRFLPFTAVAWLSMNLVVAAGHDCYPVAFSRNGTGGKWAVHGKWTSRASADNKIQSAMEKFVNTDMYGQASSVDRLPSKHQAPIRSLRVLADGDNFKFSTAGLDGFVYLWTKADMGPP